MMNIRAEWFLYTYQPQPNRTGSDVACVLAKVCLNTCAEQKIGCYDVEDDKHTRNRRLHCTHVMEKL